MSELSKAKFLRIVISEKYEQAGVTKYRELQVGSAWVKRDKNGDEYISGRIVEGIGLSGNFSVFQWREREPEAPSTSTPPPPRRGSR